MINNKKKTLFGFTLIELLLVIAVIAVLAVFGVNLAQRANSYFKVQRAVLQLKQLLQAGTSYYATYSGWPKDGNTAVCNGDFCSFIPALEATKSNPFGTDAKGYSWSSQGKQFLVTTKLSSASYAEQVVAKLPAAMQSATDKSIVIAGTVAPVGYTRFPGASLFITAGEVPLTCKTNCDILQKQVGDGLSPSVFENTDPIVIPAICPSHYNYKLLLFPGGFTFYQKPKRPVWWATYCRSMQLGVKEMSVVSHGSDQEGNKTFIVDAKIDNYAANKVYTSDFNSVKKDVHCRYNYHELNAAYIALCVPK